jgi:hypothetical protein
MPNYFRSDGWVKTAQGPAVPGAQIWVCTQPANVTTAPPSPLALIYSDPNGLVPIQAPIISDGFGHYDFYVLAGLYTVVVALGGTIQQVYPDQSLGGVGTGTPPTPPAPPPVLEHNGVPNGNQGLLNLVAGTNVTIVDDGLGDITISSSGGGFGTPGVGGFWSAGMPITSMFGTAPSAEPVGNSANQITVWQFTLLSQYTISAVSCPVVTGVGGATFNFGIYTTAGNKLVDSGAINAATSATNPRNTITPVVLPIGTYYFAASATSSSATAQSYPLNSGGVSMENCINAAGSVKVGQAANPTAAGVMPSTLGTISVDSIFNAMPAAFFGV